MKYSLQAYDITPAYLQKLLDRREIFRQASNTSKALHLTFVTATGIKKNAQEGMIQSEVGLDDLFGEKVWICTFAMPFRVLFVIFYYTKISEILDIKILSNLLLLRHL